MKKDFLFFDLDGTLTDSAPGIFNSARYSLSHFGMTISDENLKKFVGPPLMESYQNLCGMDEETAKEAVFHYREYFKVKGMFENSVYDGVREMLEQLRKEGKTLAVATSKPEPYAKQILDHFGLTEYFTYIAGATFDHDKMTKADVLRNAVKGTGAQDLDRCLMIGDRKHDVEGGNTVGMETLGVLYGYGSPEELTEEGAAGLAETPADVITKILCLE